MDEARISEQDGALVVAGAITFETVSSLYAQMLQAIGQEGVRSLTLDFSAVRRIDSSAVALLTGVQLAARKQGREAEFTGLNNEIRSLVTLYGVDWVVDPQSAPHEPAPSPPVTGQ